MGRTLMLRPTKDDIGKLTGMVLLCSEVGVPYAALHVDDLWMIVEDNGIHKKLRGGEKVNVKFEEVA